MSSKDATTTGTASTIPYPDCLSLPGLTGSGETLRASSRDYQHCSYRPQVLSPARPVERDTSQADDFRDGGVSSTIARRARGGWALKPIRQTVRQHFGEFVRHVAHGLSVRHDHGLQNVPDPFQSELSFLGIENSPAFSRAPEAQWLRRALHPHTEGKPATGRCAKTSVPPDEPMAAFGRPDRPSE